MTKDAALIIPYSGQKVLLQYRDKNTQNRADMWSFFGGSIEPGERPFEAAIRELYEELDMAADGLKFFKRIIRPKESGTFVKHFFMLPTSHTAQYFKKNLKEGKDADFFVRADIVSLKMKDFDKKILYSFWDR